MAVALLKVEVIKVRLQERHVKGSRAKGSGAVKSVMRRSEVIARMRQAAMVMKFVR